MKKFAGFLIMLSAVVFAGCAAHNRDDLPQIVRLDRDVVAQASLGITRADIVAAAAAEDADAAEDAGPTTTFYVDDDGVLVFYLAHQSGPTHPISVGLLWFQDEIYARSNGQMRVEIIDSARIGADVALKNMVIANELDTSLITIWGIWHTFTDAANLESLPFVFDNYDEAWAAYEGRLGQWVIQNIIEPHGARSVGFWTNGLRHFTNNVRPFYMPEDMNGVRMRSPQIATNLAMYEIFGSASVSMAFDLLYDALYAGQVDGQDNPISNIHAAGLHYVQQYLTLSAHMYSSAPLIVSTDFWNFMTPAQRQILEGASRYAARRQGEMARDLEDEQMRDIIASGTLVNEVNRAAFMAAVEPIWIDHIERFGAEFITLAAQYISDTGALAHQFGN